MSSAVLSPTLLRHSPAPGPMPGPYPPWHHSRPGEEAPQALHPPFPSRVPPALRTLPRSPLSCGSLCLLCGWVTRCELSGLVPQEGNPGPHCPLDPRRQDPATQCRAGRPQARQQHPPGESTLPGAGCTTHPETTYTATGTPAQTHPRLHPGTQAGALEAVPPSRTGAVPMPSMLHGHTACSMRP